MGNQTTQTCLKFLKSGRDGACAVGDGVALARHELALDVGDVHEQLLPGILKGGREKISVNLHMKEREKTAELSRKRTKEARANEIGNIYVECLKGASLSNSKHGMHRSTST